MDILKDRIAGALYGVAVGDAMGGPLEFMTAEEIAEQHGRVSSMIGGGWLNLRPGETTDDTAMTLAVAEGIMEAPTDPIPAIGERFIQWAKSGPKDIGGTCSRSIKWAHTLAYHGEARPTAPQWYTAARYTSEENNGRSGGNGALMRAIYPALYYQDREDAILVTSEQGRMTHWDDQSDEACRLYADMVHYIVSEAEKGRNDSDGHLGRHITEILEPTRYNLEDVDALGHVAKLSPTGYVVDSLNCALYAFWSYAGSFEEAVVYAANLGGDADTIAAICGGLAGAFYGFEAIPKEWVAALSNADRARLDAAVDAAVKNRRNTP